MGFGALLMLTASLFGSCRDLTDDTDYDEIEQEVLDMWMVDNEHLYKSDYPTLLTSRQDEGYYIYIQEDGTEGEAVKPGDWVQYSIKSYDLDGNICNTRSEAMAVQLNTFTFYTRYASFTDYVPDPTELDDDYDFDNDTDADEAEEAIEYILQSSTLNIDGVQTAVEFRKGSKFVIYMPSELTGTANGVGGYAGQYSLLGYRPMVSEIEITEVMDSDYAGSVMRYEKNLVDQFITNNGGVSQWNWLDDDNADYIYVNSDYYNPVFARAGESAPDRFDYGYTDGTFYPYTTRLYRDGYLTDDQYNGNITSDELAVLVEDMNERFYAELADEDNYDGYFEEDRDDDEIGEDGTVYIYDIARTLDGFIIDTKISDVQEVIYGTTTSNTSILSYEASYNKSDYITAWYYAIQGLVPGQWAAFLTTSGNAYGSSGSAGSTSSTEIPPYTPLLFEIFIQPI